MSQVNVQSEGPCALILHVVHRLNCQSGKIGRLQMCVAEKDAGEKQMFRLTPLLHFLPYYLTDVSYLITHQVLPRNYGYVIRSEVANRKDLLTLLIYFYQIFHINVKEIYQIYTYFCSLCSAITKLWQRKVILSVLRMINVVTAYSLPGRCILE